MPPKPVPQSIPRDEQEDYTRDYPRVEYPRDQGRGQCRAISYNFHRCDRPGRHKGIHVHYGYDTALRRAAPTLWWVRELK